MGFGKFQDIIRNIRVSYIFQKSFYTMPSVWGRLCACVCMCVDALESSRWSCGSTEFVTLTYDPLGIFAIRCVVVRPGGVTVRKSFCKAICLYKGDFYAPACCFNFEFWFQCHANTLKDSMIFSLQFSWIFSCRSYEIYNVNFVPLFSGFLFDSLASGFSLSLLQIRNVHPQGQFLPFLQHFPLLFFRDCHNHFIGHW